MEKIIVKRGFNSIFSGNKEYKFLEIFKLKPKWVLSKLEFIESEYFLYGLVISRKDKASKYNTFEMLISKEEVDIIDLLDSNDYSNFLIAKALIKQKLKSYG